MFHIISQRGIYTLNDKVLQHYTLKRNNYFYFQRIRRILSFSNQFFFRPTNIFIFKHLPNSENEAKHIIINHYYHPSYLDAPFGKKTLVTTKEYVLNRGNEFEQVKTEFPEQGKTKQKNNKNILSIITKREQETNKTHQNDEAAQTENIKNELKNEIIEEFEEHEEKLQKLLRKRKIPKNILTITEEATKQIKKIIEKHNNENKNSDKVLKLFFITKGCNGLTHSLKFISRNKIMKDDEIIYDNDKQILLVIDSKCVLFVINTKLDFYRDELTERFVFSNPNITSVCPCGTSFHFSKENTDEDE